MRLSGDLSQDDSSELAEGVGVDTNISRESDTIPKLKFVRDPLDVALPNFSSNYFDLTLLISVLEHLDSPLNTLIECRRILKPNGLLLINVLTWVAKPVLEISAFKFGTSPASGIEEHKMYYGKRDLWPIIVKAGFKPSRIKLSYKRLGMVLFGLVTKEE